MTSALFREPTGLFLVQDEQVLYVADTRNHVIRSQDLSSGEVATLVGTPKTLGFAGAGGLATEALLYRPQVLTLCPNGDLFASDTGNHRVRRLVAGTGILNTVLGDGSASSAGQGSPSTNCSVSAPSVWSAMPSTISS